MNQQSDAGTPDPKMAIVIAGDVMVDHHLYEGERGAPTMVDKRGVVELPGKIKGVRTR